METTTLNLKDSYYYKQWQSLIQNEGLVIENLDDITETFGIYEDDKLIATGSYFENVLKYLAIDPDYQGGNIFNKLVSTLINELAAQNIFHVFVFTKPQYKKSFSYLGFNLIAETEYSALLETGDYSIDQYIAELPRISGKNISAIVMNANPFTLGHRYLVEQAAQKSDSVYVFVVNQDASLFKTSERLDLIKQGTADLDNVQVVSGGQYMVSFVTFPSYFIKSRSEVATYQTQLDAKVFKRIASALKITKRFVGSEPYSPTTEIYNQSLQKVLPPEVELEILDRKAIDQDIISATKVRQAIQANDLATVQKYVPETTYKFIKDNIKTLIGRIHDGN
ncbi:[citrate (pro-3S)-lyase] ligase [Companilactobacillus crustorum]|uniref:[citrate (pro-3S)-lyase] ligase n=1 Tax=Companilactobacillus crustorum TaxID=392416 RepID=UPI000ED7874A|nr:[citrate (pro-3S)-lyase] ligase [Companilactobacillus crustorum]WDT65983.1 [citrate (pro-3S)-lyase] ligase [Companilactobacillus crustorum]HCD08404.1 [citrate (pro-3S)-lyase] ligase [Lactobacillus sp.]